MKSKIWNTYEYTKSYIRKIEDDIWPSWELEDRELWDDSRENFKFRKFMLPALILTDSTSTIFISPYIKKWLPRGDDSLHKNIELSPPLKSYPIIPIPSTEHLLDCIYITENLSNIALLPCKISLYLIRKLGPLIETSEILFDTDTESSESDTSLCISTFCWSFIYTPR